MSDSEMSASTDQFGPLPEPAIRAAPVGQEAWPFPKVGYYTAEQMQTYAARERAAERERCANICDDLGAERGWDVSADECARAIRGA